jgi:hypothetical protein
MRTKHIIGDFEGFFEGAKTFLTPKIVLSTAKRNFGINKNPRNYESAGVLNGSLNF